MHREAGRCHSEVWAEVILAEATQEVRRSNQKHADKIREASYRRKAEQKALIDQIKVERGCADCGYAAHPAALEFDHVADNKEANVSRLIGSTWARIETEIAKCEVVCANCHRIRTVERWQR